MAADRLFELDADLLALATALEGHPDNVAAALHGGFVDLRRRRGHALRSARRAWRRVLVVPHEAVRTTQARARAAGRGPASPTRSSTSRTARCSRSGLARGDWDLSRAASPTACTSTAARTSSRARWSSSAARAELGALGATISGAGPTVLVWARFDADRRASSRRCGARPRAGPTSSARRSSRTGADVRAL